MLCISGERARRAGVRPLRIGIINVMPRGEAYEPLVLSALGRAAVHVEPAWIRLRTHRYKSADPRRLERFYRLFESVVARGPLDGLVLTGAPVEEIEFEEVTYWDELSAILAFARTGIASTLGLCWGGLALARLLGIRKEVFPKKLFGVYETRNLDRTHPVTGGMDDRFWCPQSRHSGVSDTAMEAARDRGAVRLLAHAGEAGYTIFEGADRRFLAHLGHPEYEADRLVDEYRRDIARGRTDVPPPVNLDIDAPVNRWSGHATEFFAKWLRHLCERAALARWPRFQFRGWGDAVHHRRWRRIRFRLDHRKKLFNPK